MKDKFLTNYSNETFLERIKHSLEKRNSFAFSVSFIKNPGLILFEKIMEEALIRGIKEYLFNAKNTFETTIFRTEINTIIDG